MNYIISPLAVAVTVSFVVYKLDSVGLTSIGIVSCSIAFPFVVFPLSPIGIFIGEFTLLLPLNNSQWYCPECFYPEVKIVTAATSI